MPGAVPVCSTEEVQVMKLDAVTSRILKFIDERGFRQKGAFNLRYNGQAVCHGDTENIRIVKKKDNPGIDVYISGGTKGEDVYKRQHGDLCSSL